MNRKMFSHWMLTLVMLVALVGLVLPIQPAAAATSADNVKVAQQYYDALGKGDFKTIQGLVASNLEVDYPGPSQITFAGTYHGAQGLMDFMTKMNKEVGMAQIKVNNMVAQDNTVVALLNVQIHPAKKTLNLENVQVLTFDSNGKISRIQIFEDTGAIVQALQPAGGPGLAAPAQANEQVVRQLLGSTDWSTWQPNLAQNFIYYDPSGQEIKGINAYKAYFDQINAAFPDYKLAPEDFWAQGDAVIVRLTASGTFSGSPLMGMQPTGKSFSIPCVRIFHMQNGKVVQEREYFDMLTVFQQLGVAPTMQSSTQQSKG